MKGALSTLNPAKAPGLPASVLFQHLERSPGGRKVTIEFLKESVWWWRNPDVALQIWLGDLAIGWPYCELYKLLESWQPNEIPRSSEEAQDRARELFGHINARPELRQQLAQLWDCEYDAAKGYEWEARQKGAYPLGKPYCVLTPAQRNKWRVKYFRLNLNAIPPVWVKEDSPPYDFDTDKLTADFHFDLWSGVGLIARFNIRHGNGWLTRSFKQEIVQQRKRRGISDSDKLRPEDGVVIRKFKQFIAEERKRLGIPNPKYEGKDRRSLFNRSWADIENIDIKTRSNGRTTLLTRQRESVTRRKLLSPHERQRQLADWKLTVSEKHPPGGSVTRGQL